MGIYDQFLALTQQGLNNNLQVQQQALQRPTMAEAFLDRYRQGGLDLMNKQKTASEMGYQNQMAQNAAFGRQVQAATGASAYATPGSMDTWNLLLQSQGMAPISDTGFKQYAIDTRAATMADATDQKREAAAQRNKMTQDRIAENARKLDAQIGLWNSQAQKNAVVTNLMPGEVASKQALRGAMGNAYGAQTTGRVLGVTTAFQDVGSDMKALSRLAALGSDLVDNQPFFRNQADDLATKYGLPKGADIGSISDAISNRGAQIAAGANNDAPPDSDATVIGRTTKDKKWIVKTLGKWDRNTGL